MNKSVSARSRFCRMIVVLVAVIAASLSSGELASATTPSPASRSSPVTSAVVSEPVVSVEVASARRTVVLGPKATKRIIAALATGGTGLAVIACQAAAPPDIKQYCGLIVSVLAGLRGIGDAGEKCLSITLGFGIPPVRVSLVPCPVPDPIPVPGGSNVLESVPGGSTDSPSAFVPLPVPGFVA